METKAIIAISFDIALSLGLVWLAWRLLSSKDLFKAIVVFIVFGLLMALVWVRIGAPDVALAEAAIGAGLTGALLLAALARLRFILSEEERAAQNRMATQTAAITDYEKESIVLRLLAFALTLTIAIGLAYSIFALPESAPGLSQVVQEKIALSGVKNPVTAVVVNFRGYDTLLEMFVLLIALIGIWSFGFETLREKTLIGPPVLTNLAHILAPMLVLVAAYLLWVGAHAPGGAFQAGAVLSAAGVLVLLMGRKVQLNRMTWFLRLLLILGVFVFLLTAVLTLLQQGQLLKFPVDYAGLIILMLEVFATISIAAILIVLFWLVDP